MKKMILIVFGFLGLGMMTGCVGPAYHYASYGGIYPSYYDYPYYYGFPHTGFYSNYYFSHRHHRHVIGDHKRAHHGFEQRKHSGKRFNDRSFSTDRFHGKHNNNSNWHSQQGRDGRSVKDDAPVVHRRTAIDDNRRSHKSGQQLREQNATNEKNQRLHRPGNRFERAERQPAMTGDSRRAGVKCIGARC